MNETLRFAVGISEVTVEEWTTATEEVGEEEVEEGDHAGETQDSTTEHGVCAHSSQFCNYPAEGHQNQATFQNKMGGSTQYCTPSEAK